MSKLPTDSNALIEERIASRAETLGKVVESDVISIMSDMMFPLDDIVRESIEEHRGKPKDKGKKVLVVLQTSGGQIEVARRIAETLHHHYKSVEFIVPNYAMSAGTILVMSGDAIYMDYYSVLGPIDPQVQRDGIWVAGLGYLEKYNELITKASSPTGLNTAEMTYLIEKFDPAFLHQIEQECELTKTYLKEWLVKYKFKNWKKTDGRRIDVTHEMKEQRAEEIATLLQNTKHWHAHSRGIHMGVVQRDLKLQIEDFGADDELNDAVGAYYKLLADYMSRRGHAVAVHQSNTYLGFD